jgi:hypothetical protein
MVNWKAVPLCIERIDDPITLAFLDGVRLAAKTVAPEYEIKAAFRIS